MIKKFKNFDADEFINKKNVSQLEEIENKK